MSYKLDVKTAQALTNLRANADFGQVLDWLTEQELKETDNCVSHEGTTLFRAQGAVTALRNVRKAYDEAPQTLEKFRSKV